MAYVARFRTRTVVRAMRRATVGWCGIARKIRARWIGTFVVSAVLLLAFALIVQFGGRHSALFKPDIE